MWEAKIWPDSLHIVCNGFIIYIFPHGRADNENRSQSGGAVDGNLDQTSHSHLSLHSLLSVLNSLCSSPQPWGGYLVLVCRAEVSLLSDMWTLSVCCVWSTHQSIQNRQTPSRKCETEHTRKKPSSPVWCLVIKGCCNHSFCSSPPYFCCCLSSCC